MNIQSSDRKLRRVNSQASIGPSLEADVIGPSPNTKPMWVAAIIQSVTAIANAHANMATTTRRYPAGACVNLSISATSAAANNASQPQGRLLRIATATQTTVTPVIPMSRAMTGSSQREMEEADSKGWPVER